MHDIQVSSDKTTVWVTASDGSCVGRFSKRFGLDVHNTVTDQMSGKSQCLFCTHTPASKSDWLTFCELMQKHFSIKVRTNLLKFTSSITLPE